MELYPLKPNELVPAAADPIASFEMESSTFPQTYPVIPYPPVPPGGR